MGNSVSSFFKGSEDTKQRKNNIYYKKQYDSYISGNVFMLSVPQSMQAINELDDFKKWSENFVSKNIDNPDTIYKYIKKQNLDSVKDSIDGNYEQAYYSLLAAETVQKAAKQQDMQLNSLDVLPIEESLELVSQKLTSSDRSIANAIKTNGLKKMVNDVAYQDGQLRQKEELEQNVVKGYVMSLQDISNNDYMQSYGGFNIIKGVKDLAQSEYASKDEWEVVRGVTPQPTSFADRNFDNSSRQI